MSSLVWDSTGQVNLYLQSIISNPNWLLPFSIVGDELFYLVLIPFVFFVVDKRAGVALLFALLLTSSFNSMVKLWFQQPRPYWVTDIHVGAFEDSYSLPSGHAQNAVVIWGFLTSFLIQSGRANRKIIIGTIILIFLITLSRLVVGVHFLQDVLAGWLIGLILLFLLIRYESTVANFYNNQTAFGKFFIMAAISVLTIEIGALSMPNTAAVGATAWFETARQNLVASGVSFKELQPHQINPFLTTAGCLMGAYFAMQLPEPMYRTPQLFRNRVLLLIPGLVLIGAVYFVLHAIFPSAGIEGAILRMLRYALVVFSGLYIYPYLVGLIQKRNPTT
ncbi:MAG: phosphatase PAP2 family protein [Leptonema sp. (in: Bacteria)]|nr:phosphatase PAP2 family protein [Leptonema sp. (in: bacteria)]